MSDNLEQPVRLGGTIGEMPQPCKPKEPSSATAAAAPSLSSFRRVKFCIGLRLKMRSPEQRIGGEFALADVPTRRLDRQLQRLRHPTSFRILSRLRRQLLGDGTSGNTPSSSIPGTAAARNLSNDFRFPASSTCPFVPRTDSCQVRRIACPALLPSAAPMPTSRRSWSGQTVRACDWAWAAWASA